MQHPPVGATHKVKTIFGWLPAKRVKKTWYVYAFNRWPEYRDQQAKFKKIYVIYVSNAPRLGGAYRCKTIDLCSKP